MYSFPKIPTCFTSHPRVTTSDSDGRAKHVHKGSRRPLPGLPAARGGFWLLPPPSASSSNCISEDIKLHKVAVGKYSLASLSDHVPLPDSHRVSVKVTSPYGNSIHYADQVDSGNFAFTSNESGDYLACFSAHDQKPPVRMALDFEWRTGFAAKDWTGVAIKGQIEAMELELKKLEDVVKSIHDEMFYLRKREEQMQDMNRSTNSRMAWLGFLSLAVCLSVAGLQLWHLKKFFKKKKLL